MIREMMRASCVEMIKACHVEMMRASYEGKKCGDDEGDDEPKL